MSLCVCVRPFYKCVCVRPESVLFVRNFHHLNRQPFDRQSQMGTEQNDLRSGSMNRVLITLRLEPAHILSSS